MIRYFRSLLLARDLSPRSPGLAGTLPVAGMAGPPLADALGVGRAFEVVGVGRLAQPLGLAVPLAGLAAVRLRAKGLPAAITRFGLEGSVAMQALGERGDAGHRPEEDVAAPGKGRPEDAKAGAPKKTRRNKKGWRLNRKKTPPRTRHHTGISDRQKSPHYGMALTARLRFGPSLATGADSSGKEVKFNGHLLEHSWHSIS